MNKYNLIWIVIDSVRSYRTGVDDRDRLDVMDKFGEEAIEFTNAFASAPSSALSASTMFTGLPACFISRHFNDWDFDEQKITSVQKLLMDQGCPLYTIFDSREGRRMMRKLIHPLPSKYYPKGISHGSWWTNKECTDILEHVLNSTNQDFPACYTMWYDCRRDPYTSNEVERALEILKKYRIYDNSIIIMCSDHGYPDPSTGLTEETMKKYSHDVIITDDNIKVPLLLKYPGCPEGVKIDEVIGTIDLFPTVCDLLGLPQQNQEFNYKGQSLLPLINKQDFTPAVVRTDTRLNLAACRVTSLRSNKYKYVYYWDESIEELYDLIEDPYETKDLLKSSPATDWESMLTDFRNLMNGMEDKVNSYHVSDLDGNFHRNINKLMSEIKQKGARRILLTSKGAPEIMVECFLNSAKKAFPSADIDLLVTERDLANYKEMAFRKIHAPTKLTMAQMSGSEVFKNEYDVVFYLTENSRQGFIDENILKILKNIKGESSYMLDYNFDTYSRFLSNWVWPVKNYIGNNIYFYRDEPALIFKDIWVLCSLALHKIFRRKGLSIDADKVKKMRDRALKANK